MNPNNEPEQDEQPPNLFTVAILAVKTAPTAFLLEGDAPPVSDPANPTNPLLFSFSLHADRLPEDEQFRQALLYRAAAAQIAPHLPPGYALAMCQVSPIPQKAVVSSAAQYCAESFLPDFSEAGNGGKFWHEPTNEAAINTFRPGLDNSGKSPRYALLCPYCGNTSVRFTGRIQARNPDGFGVLLETDPTKRGHCQTGPDVQNLPPFKEHIGVSFTATCSLNHVFTVFYIEDNTERGPEIFCILGYAEHPSIWLSPRYPGTGQFPERL